MKRILCFILVLWGIVGEIFAYDFSAVAPSGQTLYYAIRGNTHTVIVANPNAAYSFDINGAVLSVAFYSGETYSDFIEPIGDLVIPTSVVYNGISYAVTSIGLEAFLRCSGLTSVSIPGSVTSIDREAFCLCTGLMSVTLSDGVISIGQGAFSGCTALHSVIIPSTVTTIATNIFGGCTDLDVWMKSAIPPAPMYSGDSGLDFSWMDTIHIIVPYNSYELYSSAFLYPDRHLVFRDSIFVTVNNSTPTYGSVITSDNTITYPYPDSVVLTAFPNYGYHFVGWDDGTTDSMKVIHNLTHDTAFSVYFQKNQYNISVLSESDIMGIVAGSGQFYYLSELTISATPNYGYHFTSWSDGNTANPRILNLTRDTAFTALFAKNTYNLVASTSDSVKGIVTGGNTLEYLDSITILATPNYGYHFTMWNDGNTDNPRTVVATRDSLFTAIFDYNQYSVSVISLDSNMGEVSGEGSFNYLHECTVVAMAKYGYHFSSWTDGDTHIVRTFTLTQDTVFSAVFSKNMYTITGLSGNSSRGLVTGGETVDYLDSVTLIATPSYGYHFTQWNDGDTSNPRIIEASRDSVLVASFGFNKYNVLLNVDSNIYGNVYGSGMYNYLSQCNIFATANYGYHFTVWNDGDTNNPRTLTLTQDTMFTALFAKNTYSVSTVSSDTVRGMVFGDASSEYLDSVTITALPSYGYHFTAWSDGNTNNPRTIIVSKDSVLTAYFDYNQYTLALGVDTIIHGSVTGDGTYNYLSERIIFATANYGYHFTVWNDGDTNNPRTLTLTQDTMFTALFAKNTYSVSTVSSDTVRGMVFGDASSEYLDSVTITAFPNYGYHFTAWNDGDTNNPRTIIVLKDSVLTACFDYNQYTLALEVDTIIHGSVTGGGTYNYLSERTISATANYGYHFSNWNDGDTANPRTVTITQDTTLTAIFAKNTYLLVAESDDNAMGNVSGDGLFDYLDTATLEATAAPHYHFVHWSDGNTNNPRHYVITEDDTITAFFAIDTHHVSVESCDIAFGSVEGDGDYEYGTPVTVTATAYSGYTFVRWSNGITHNPYTFAVLQDTTLIAVFETETQGIDNIVDAAISVYTHGGRIIVEMEREDEINIYDIYGRKIDGGCKSHFEVPCSGAYLIKIGNHPARRVVVVR